ncbi:MAG: serine/threonine protein kinase [Deltaproteobacteria bacterium]|nr:serine/threonine protein kinase [Deltaproteobacteria bacterium]
MLAAIAGNGYIAAAMSDLPTLPILPPTEDIERTAARLTAAGISTHATVGLPPEALPGGRPSPGLPRYRTQPGTDATDDGALLALGDVLGEGGMGVVHLARQHSLSRDVAVKRVRGDLHDGSEERSAVAEGRLVTEALVTGALDHPNIVPIYELGLDEAGGPLMVMKRIEGRPWSDALSERPMPGAPNFLDWLEPQLRVLLAVCDAIRFAHARGVLHRDIKPENVMLGGFGEVLVVDWGVAVTLRDDADPRFPRARESRHIAGTPAFMAPELVDGDGRKQGVHTDVYLLGATLHELLTGRAPHDAESVHTSLFSAWESRPPAFPPGIPAPLAEICRCALARLPEDRYADVAALRSALDDFLLHRASIEITERSLRLAAQLHATPPADALDGSSQIDPLGVHKTFARCRFGFLQALEIWPENARAAAGLQDVLLLMIHRLLDAGELNQAALLIEELPLPDDVAAERLRDLRQAQKARERDLRALGAIGRRHDDRVGIIYRRRFLVGLSTIWAGVAVAEGVASERGALSPAVHAVIPFVMLLITFVYGIVRREPMRAAGVNLRLYNIATITLGAIVIERLLGAVVGAPIPLLLAFESLLFFIGIGANAAFTRRKIAPSMLAYAAGAAVGAVWPEAIFWVSAATHLLGIGSLTLAWRAEDSRAVGSPGPAPLA